MQAAGLLFPVNMGKRESSILEKGGKKDIGSYGQSFEQSLKASKNDLKTHQQGMKTTHDLKKQSRRELNMGFYPRRILENEKTEESFSQGESESMNKDFFQMPPATFIEWFMTLIFEEGKSINVSEFLEDMQTIFLSIDGNGGQQQQANVDMSEDTFFIGDAQKRNYLMQVLKEGLLAMDYLPEGVEGPLNKNSILYEKILENVSRNLGTSNKWSEAKVVEYTAIPVEPKDMMGLMGKGVNGQIIIPTVNEETEDHIVKEGKPDTTPVMKISEWVDQNVSIKEMEFSTEMSQGRNPQPNQPEETISFSEEPESIHIGSIKMGGDNQIVDFTKVLDKSQPAHHIDMIGDLAEKISMNFKDSRYEMELQLKPEHLGKIILKVAMEDGVLSGKIYTSTPQARELLQSNLEDLKVLLQEQGHNFSQLDVNVGSESFARQFQYPEKSKFSIYDDSNSPNSFDEAIEDQIQKKSIVNPTNPGGIDYFA